MSGYRAVSDDDDLYGSGAEGAIDSAETYSAPSTSTATGTLNGSALLADTAKKARQRTVAWDGYARANIISGHEHDLITRFDGKGYATQRKLMETEGPVFAGLFLSLLSKTKKTDVLQNVLNMVDELMVDGVCTAATLQAADGAGPDSPWEPFLGLLHNNDEFVVFKSYMILCRLSASRYTMSASKIHQFMMWINKRLENATTDVYVFELVAGLMLLLRNDAYRIPFFEQPHTVQGLISLLTSRSTAGPLFQAQYQIIFCFWLLLFNRHCSAHIARHSIVPTLVDVLKSTNKEKVTRIVFSLFRNMLEKEFETEQEDKLNTTKASNNAAAMVTFNVPTIIKLAAAKQWADEDIAEDIAFLQDKLMKAMHELSSFDKYATEVRSGKLKWTPVHRSDKFWTENGPRLGESNFELIKILVELCASSEDPTVVAVACHDLGECVRHNTHGKRAIERFDGKQAIMRHMTHKDSTVRYEALVAVQKLMVHNWEYLGNSLPQAK